MYLSGSMIEVFHIAKSYQLGLTMPGLNITEMLLLVLTARKGS